MAPFEEWRDERSRRSAATGPRRRSSRSPGREVVGYAKLSLSEALPDVAFHDITGVKREPGAVAASPARSSAPRSRGRSTPATLA